MALNTIFAKAVLDKEDEEQLSGLLKTLKSYAGGGDPAAARNAMQAMLGIKATAPKKTYKNAAKAAFAGAKTSAGVGWDFGWEKPQDPSEVFSGASAGGALARPQPPSAGQPISLPKTDIASQVAQMLEAQRASLGRQQPQLAPTDPINRQLDVNQFSGSSADGALMGAKSGFEGAQASGYAEEDPFLKNFPQSRFDVSAGTPAPFSLPPSLTSKTPEKVLADLARPQYTKNPYEAGAPMPSQIDTLPQLMWLWDRDNPNATPEERLLAKQKIAQMIQESNDNPAEAALELAGGAIERNLAPLKQAQQAVTNAISGATGVPERVAALAANPFSAMTLGQGLPAQVDETVAGYTGDINKEKLASVGINQDPLDYEHNRMAARSFIDTTTPSSMESIPDAMSTAGRALNQVMPQNILADLARAGLYHEKAQGGQVLGKDTGQNEAMQVAAGVADLIAEFRNPLGRAALVLNAPNLMEQSKGIAQKYQETEGNVLEKIVGSLDAVVQDPEMSIFDKFQFVNNILGPVTGKTKDILDKRYKAKIKAQQDAQKSQGIDPDPDQGAQAKQPDLPDPGGDQGDQAAQPQAQTPKTKPKTKTKPRNSKEAKEKLKAEQEAKAKAEAEAKAQAEAEAAAAAAQPAPAPTPKPKPKAKPKNSKEAKEKLKAEQEAKKAEAEAEAKAKAEAEAKAKAEAEAKAEVTPSPKPEQKAQEKPKPQPRARKPKEAVKEVDPFADDPEDVATGQIDPEKLTTETKPEPSKEDISAGERLQDDVDDADSKVFDAEEELRLARVNGADEYEVKAKQRDLDEALKQQADAYERRRKFLNGAGAAAIFAAGAAIGSAAEDDDRETNTAGIFGGSQMKEVAYGAVSLWLAGKGKKTVGGLVQALKKTAPNDFAVQGIRVKHLARAVYQKALDMGKDFRDASKAASAILLMGDDIRRLLRDETSENRYVYGVEPDLEPRRSASRYRDGDESAFSGKNEESTYAALEVIERLNNATHGTLRDNYGPHASTKRLVEATGTQYLADLLAGVAYIYNKKRVGNETGKAAIEELFKEVSMGIKRKAPVGESGVSQEANLRNLREALVHLLNDPEDNGLTRRQIDNLLDDDNNWSSRELLKKLGLKIEGDNKTRAELLEEDVESSGIARFAQVKTFDDFVKASQKSAETTDKAGDVKYKDVHMPPNGWEPPKAVSQEVKKRALEAYDRLKKQYKGKFNERPADIYNDVGEYKDLIQWMDNLHDSANNLNKFSDWAALYWATRKIETFKPNRQPFNSESSKSGDAVSAHERAVKAAREEYAKFMDKLKRDIESGNPDIEGNRDALHDEMIRLRTKVAKAESDYKMVTGRDYESSKAESKDAGEIAKGLNKKIDEYNELFARKRKFIEELKTETDAEGNIKPAAQANIKRHEIEMVDAALEVRGAANKSQPDINSRQFLQAEKSLSDAAETTKEAFDLKEKASTTQNSVIPDINRRLARLKKSRPKDANAREARKEKIKDLEKQLKDAEESIVKDRAKANKLHAKARMLEGKASAMGVDKQMVSQIRDIMEHGADYKANVVKTISPVENADAIRKAHRAARRAATMSNKRVEGAVASIFKKVVSYVEGKKGATVGAAIRRGYLNSYTYRTASEKSPQGEFKVSPYGKKEKVIAINRPPNIINVSSKDFDNVAMELGFDLFPGIPEGKHSRAISMIVHGIDESHVKALAKMMDARDYLTDKDGNIVVKQHTSPESIGALLYMNDLVNQYAKIAGLDRGAAAYDLLHTKAIPPIRIHPKDLNKIQRTVRSLVNDPTHSTLRDPSFWRNEALRMSDKAFTETPTPEQSKKNSGKAKLKGNKAATTLALGLITAAAATSATAQDGSEGQGENTLLPMLVMSALGGGSAFLFTKKGLSGIKGNPLHRKMRVAGATAAGMGLGGYISLSDEDDDYSKIASRAMLASAGLGVMSNLAGVKIKRALGDKSLSNIEDFGSALDPKAKTRLAKLGVAYKASVEAAGKKPAWYTGFMPIATNLKIMFKNVPGAAERAGDVAESYNSKYSEFANNWRTRYEAAVRKLQNQEESDFSQNTTEAKDYDSSYAFKRATGKVDLTDPGTKAVHEALTDLFVELNDYAWENGLGVPRRLQDVNAKNVNDLLGKRAMFYDKATKKWHKGTITKAVAGKAGAMAQIWIDGKALVEDRFVTESLVNVDTYFPRVINPEWNRIMDTLITSGADHIRDVANGKATNPYLPQAYAEKLVKWLDDRVASKEAADAAAAWNELKSWHGSGADVEIDFLNSSLSHARVANKTKMPMFMYDYNIHRVVDEHIANIVRSAEMSRVYNSSKSRLMDDLQQVDEAHRKYVVTALKSLTGIDVRNKYDVPMGNMIGGLASWAGALTLMHNVSSSMAQFASLGTAVAEYGPVRTAKGLIEGTGRRFNILGGVLGDVAEVVKDPLINNKHIMAALMGHGEKAKAAAAELMNTGVYGNNVEKAFGDGRVRKEIMSAMLFTLSGPDSAVRAASMLASKSIAIDVHSKLSSTDVKTVRYVDDYLKKIGFSDDDIAGMRANPQNVNNQARIERKAMVFGSDVVGNPAGINMPLAYYENPIMAAGFRLLTFTYVSTRVTTRQAKRVVDLYKQGRVAEGSIAAVNFALGTLGFSLAANEAREWMLEKLGFKTDGTPYKPMSAKTFKDKVVQLFANAAEASIKVGGYGFYNAIPETMGLVSGQDSLRGLFQPLLLNKAQRFAKDAKDLNVGGAISSMLGGSALVRKAPIVDKFLEKGEKARRKKRKKKRKSSSDGSSDPATNLMDNFDDVGSYGNIEDTLQGTE